MRVFNTLVDAIGTEIGEAFPMRFPVSVVHLLKRIQLVLPNHLYPLDTLIPKLDGNFFSNTLKVREHRLDFWSYKAHSGIPQGLVKYLGPEYGVQSGCFVVPPLVEYSVIPLRNTMNVLPMAVLGFVLADSLWTVLLDSNWSVGQNSTVRNSLCSDQGGTGRTTPRNLVIRHPPTGYPLDCPRL
ncbi:hypothetical protein MRX96_048183 [Rhipicephalus microplus]